MLRKIIGVGGPENDNFSLLYVRKMSLHRVWVVLKPQNTCVGPNLVCTQWKDLKKFRELAQEGQIYSILGRT